ncbi:MAG: hydrogenase maturation nickel metallochaperone HypA [Pirellulaceae bacterium]
MHELSIANSLVEIALEQLEHAESADVVRALRLEIGALSCVHRDALNFSYEMVTKGTRLEGSVLEIIDLPAVVFCPNCNSEQTLQGIQKFRCPECDLPTAEIRQGRELELVAIEFENAVTTN